MENTEFVSWVSILNFKGGELRENGSNGNLSTFGYTALEELF